MCVSINESLTLWTTIITPTLPEAPSIHLIRLIHGPPVFQPNIKTRAERGQATCSRVPATKDQGYSSNLSPGLVPKLLVLLWPTPLFQQQCLPLGQGR